jgi:hypothetical protein
MNEKIKRLSKNASTDLDDNLQGLKLPFIRDNYEALAKEAAKDSSSHVDTWRETVPLNDESDWRGSR